MQVKLEELLQETGLEEQLYPGKRVVKRCKQTGQYKSHCVVYDWRIPEKVILRIKAGLSGRDLSNQDLGLYPICFQAPTYVEMTMNDNEDEDENEDEEEGRASGGGGGKGKKPKKAKKLSNALQAFGEVVEGKIPNSGEITKMVVMGKNIAKEAFGPVMEALVHQIKNLKISPTDLLAKSGKVITKYTPPSFLQPTGDEDKVYKYSQEKNEAMFGNMKPT
jgi:hypothetical protein